MIDVQVEEQVVECGDEVTGTITWRQLPNNPRRVVVELRYKTSGRGDTDKAGVDSATFEPSTSGHGAFRLRVPSKGPVSYDGSLMRVQWHVRGYADLVLAGDPDDEVAIGVVPRGALKRDGYEPQEVERPTDEILPPYEPPA